jgi:CDP-diglyceride synthetase
VSTYQSALVLHGGVVLLVGLLVGFPYGAAVVAKAEPASVQNWRLAHVQNIQNGMLLLLIAACSSYLRLSLEVAALMAWLLIGAAYCDMLALFIRAATGHPGLLPKSPLPNVLVFALFGLTLVGQLSGICIFVFGAWRAMTTSAT